MKKVVAIVSKPQKAELHEIAPELAAWLRNHGYELLIDDMTAAYGIEAPVVTRQQIAGENPGFVIVLGGDGTMLATARAVARAKIPILGVNLGSLGFLTEVAVEELYPMLEMIERGACSIETRAMLSCAVEREGRMIETYLALNDAVLNKTHLARLTDFDVFIDGAFVANYKADGIIVATPTGSTAYSLAAGGPILLPDLSGFVITPVSPHALTNRPLVVRERSEVAVVVNNAREETFLSIDGQIGTPVRKGDRIVCGKSEHGVQLIKPANRSF